MQEAARHRELDRLLAFSAPRDSMPIAWRRALRFIFLVSIIDKCQNTEPGAYLLLRAAIRPGASRSGPGAEVVTPQPVGVLGG